MPIPPHVPPTTTTPSAASKIRLYRTMFRGMEELRTEIKKEHGGVIRWKKRTVAFAVLALLMGGGVVAAITSTQTSYSGVSGEAFSYDTTLFTIVSQGHTVASTTQAAVGTTSGVGTAIEMTPSSGGAARTALTAGHWVYQAQINEAAINTISPVSQTQFFKAELFQDGTSLGAVYVKNVDLLDLTSTTTIEGVTVKWSVGATLPASASYVVKITQVSA